MTLRPCAQSCSDLVLAVLNHTGHIRLGGLLGGLLLLGACTSFQPRQLPDRPDLASDPTMLKLDTATLPLPPLRGHPLNPADGLDAIEMAMLALSNNPKLKAARRRHNLAQAQTFAAGLLPDPQLSASLTHPTGGVGQVDGYGLGLSQDLGSLITRETNQAATRASQEQVDLQLLWEEWQVVQKARELTVRLQASQRKLKLLRKARGRHETNQRRSQQLFSRGDLTLNEVAATATTLATLERRIHQQQQEAEKTRHALLALLGLSARVKLPLTGFQAPPDRSLTISEDAWQHLTRHRPDLLALRAGYQSQEQRVRQAILRQFPALTIGFTRSRDNDGLYTSGLGITLDLPLFSGGRGQIAIERATRERLRSEYQARLDQTRSDIERLLDRQKLLRRQLDDLNRQRPYLQSLTDTARRGYKHGDLRAFDLYALEGVLLENRLATIDLQQSLWQVHIALDTLLIWPQSKDQQ